jgi:hypothetical protein
VLALVIAVEVVAGLLAASLLPEPRARQPRIAAPSACRRSVDPASVDERLVLPNAVAQTNLYNTRSSTGWVQQCYDRAGLTTQLAFKRIAPKGPGPAGYPEIAYGYDLYGQPFCGTCPRHPFPLALSDVTRSTSDYLLVDDYS